MKHMMRWVLSTLVGLYWVASAGPVFSQDYGEGLEVQKDTFAWPESKKMGLSLSFDDARFTQIENCVPLLDRYHLRGTFYVSVTRIEKRLELWKKAVRNGHDIGNHTLQHGCSRNFDWSRHKALENYTVDQIASEIEAASNIIRDLLGVQPQSFAYPCGQTYVGEGVLTRSYVPVITKQFQTGRTWYDEKPNDPLYCNLHQLTGIKLDGLSAAEAISIVEQAVLDGDWLIFVGHETLVEGGKDSLTTPLATLEAICQYAANPENGVWMDSVRTIADYVVAQRKQLRP